MNKLSVTELQNIDGGAIYYIVSKLIKYIKNKYFR